VVIAKTADLWHGPDDDEFATIKDNKRLEHYGIGQDNFERWLGDKYGDRHRIEIDGELVPTYPKQSELKEALFQIKNHCRRGEMKTPRTRLNYVDGTLWLDLGNKAWGGVKITADGWEVAAKIEAPVIRYRGMLELPEPVPGDIAELRQFVNVRDDDFVLFCGNTAGLFNTFGNYVTTIFCGPANSGKTTATRFMRGLVDPHVVDTRPFTTVRDLNHSNTHIIALENVSNIDADLSDAICRLNTGSGYSERKLYEQGKEFLKRLHCPVLINGIPSNLAERDDLLDRTITFAFGSFADGPVSDDALRRRYEAARPRLLGALLDGVVGALRVRREFGGDNDAAAETLLGGWRPRFIDFAVFAEAACRAMGFADGAFVKAYKDNLGYALRYHGDRNPICVGIVKLMRTTAEWRGTPGQLYSAVLPYTIGMDTKLPNPSWLAREGLSRAIPILRKGYGIKVLMRQRGINDNDIVIEKVPMGTHFDESFIELEAEAFPAKPKNPEKMGTHGYPTVERKI
jgi:hypothetical protein